MLSKQAQIPRQTVQQSISKQQMVLLRLKYRKMEMWTLLLQLLPTKTVQEYRWHTPPLWFTRMTRVRLILFQIFAKILSVHVCATTLVVARSKIFAHCSVQRQLPKVIKPTIQRTNLLQRPLYQTHLLFHQPSQTMDVLSMTTRFRLKIPPYLTHSKMHQHSLHG